MKSVYSAILRLFGVSSSGSGKRVYWVFGSSGAGKKTFIQGAVGDSGVCSRFGIAEPIDLVPESFLLRKARERLFTAICKALRRKDNILVKTQTVDFRKTPLIHRVAAKYPLLRHEILFLVTTREVVRQRCLERAQRGLPFWVEHAESFDYEKEILDQIGYAKRFSEEMSMPVRIIDTRNALVLHSTRSLDELEAALLAKNSFDGVGG